MLSMVKMLLKGEVGCSALNSHGNYIVDHEISWKNHGVVFLNFCRIPDPHVTGGTTYMVTISNTNFEKKTNLVPTSRPI